MFNGIMMLWFVFVLMSLAYVAYDVREQPVEWVQKLGWILVVAYTGPFGLFFYILTCKSPGLGLHKAYTQATWKQGINSEIHCLAGDATGIILAAIVLSLIELPIAVELLLEYLSAFIFGWFIFQAGMMKSMYANYFQALRKTFFAEMLSMNFVMMGMIPVMLILMNVLPHGHDPAHAHFWFSMGMATLVGGFFAYPINHWLVKNNLKHGCMTLTEKEDMPHMEPHKQHEMGGLPLKTELIYIGISFAALLLLVILTPLIFLLI